MQENVDIASLNYVDLEPEVMPGNICDIPQQDLSETESDGDPHDADFCEKYDDNCACMKI